MNITTLLIALTATSNVLTIALRVHQLRTIHTRIVRAASKMLASVNGRNA